VTARREQAAGGEVKPWRSVLREVGRRRPSQGEPVKQEEGAGRAGLGRGVVEGRLHGSRWPAVGLGHGAGALVRQGRGGQAREFH
jgi:hypothetical protein